MWLLWLNIIDLKFTRIVCCVYKQSILFIAWLYPIIWKNHSLFIHLLFDELVSDFHIAVVTNKTVMNICVLVFVWAYALISQGKYLEVEWLDHMTGICLSF